MSATITETVIEPTTDAPHTGETPAAEPFDADRAMKTIANLREYEKEAKRLKKELADLKAAEDTAKDSALAEQAQFKELADKRAEKIVELQTQVKQIETLQQERDRLANVVDGLVKQQREGLPEYVIELLDGKDAVDQLAWITKNRETLTGVNGRPSVGINPAPRPAGPVNRDQLIAQEIEAQRSRRR